MSEVCFKSASRDKMATGSTSVLHAYVHTASYSGHGGVRCYTPLMAPCAYQIGSLRKENAGATRFLFSRCRGGLFAETNSNTDTSSPSLAQCATLKHEQ